MKNTVYLKKFTKYTSLNVLGMVGLSCYILADTFFVAKGLGSNGLAALNLALPIYSFINGCGLLFGMGGATKYTILKSQEETHPANLVFTNTVLLALVFAAGFFVMGVFFSGTIAKAFGAVGVVFQMSKTYLQVILLFAPMFMLNNVLLCFVRNDGAPQRSMLAMIGGSLSNVVLDYVFIFPCNMGIFGAVLATGLAPIISMLLLSPFFLKRKHHFHFASGPLPKKLYGPIFSGGLPSLITEASSGIVILMFNAIILQLQGTVGVAAYGVIANLALVVIALYTGIAQGVQPLISSYYGAGNRTAVHAISRYAFIFMLALSAIVYVSVFFGASQIVGIFNHAHDMLLESIAVTGLKIYFVGCVFAGFNIILSVYFTSTEYVRPAHIISMLRGFFLIIPAAFLLSSLGGIVGIWCAFPVTEFVVSSIGILLYRLVKRRIQAVP